MPEAGMEAKQLYAAVQSLPQKYREVILLHFYQDMSVGEIAQTLHIAASSIYRRMKKAQQLLKKKLERWDFCG